MFRIDFTVLLYVEFLKVLHLPGEQVKNRIHQPDSKIHYSDTTFFARCAASLFYYFVEILAETFWSHSPAFSFQNSLGDKGCFTPFWEDELELDESEVLLRSSSESNKKKEIFHILKTNKNYC